MLHTRDFGNKTCFLGAFLTWSTTISSIISRKAGNRSNSARMDLDHAILVLLPVEARNHMLSMS